MALIQLLKACENLRGRKVNENWRGRKGIVISTCWSFDSRNQHMQDRSGPNYRDPVELASYFRLSIPSTKVQPLVSSFYYWNMLTYSRTNRSISISIRLRSLNLGLGISVVIVSPPRCGVNHMVRWESGI
jgi:hypothetical protein